MTTLADATKQIVLEEEFDENYEPSQEEIIEYAKFLGMDEDEDKHLFWIARESLKAPLPPDWKPCQSDDGNIYYFNFSTGESIWDHPCDEHYRQLYEREKKKGKPADKSSPGNKKEADGRSKKGASRESISRDSSKSPRPQNAPVSKTEPVAASLGVKVLPALPTKSLTPLQPIGAQKASTSLTAASSTNEKPSFSTSASLGGIKPAGLGTISADKSPNSPKIASTLSREILHASDNDEDDLKEEDIEDFGEDDHLNHSATQPAIVETKKSKPDEEEETPWWLKTEDKVPGEKKGTADNGSGDSQSELAKIQKRSTGIMETTDIKPFGHGSPKSSSLNIKKDNDPLSRALNRLSSDSLDLSDDEKTQSKNGQKFSTKASERYEDEVSDFDDEPLSFPGLENSKGVKGREGTSRAYEHNDENSSDFDSKDNSGVIQSIHSLPPERPSSSKKPRKRREKASDTNSLSESVSSLKLKATISKDVHASGVKIQSIESIQSVKIPEEPVISAVESTLGRGVGIHSKSKDDSRIEEKHHNAWSEMSHLERFGTEVVAIGAACMAYHEWRKLHNKPDNTQSEIEHAEYLELCKQEKNNIEKNNDSHHSAHITTAVAFAGVAYLAYNDWRKHHDKPDNSQSEKEHAAYVESLKQREHQEKVHPHHFPNMATQIAAAGGTYLAYQDWRKHYNRPDNAQSEKEHELHVELHKQGWHRSDHSQPLISELAIGGVIPYMTYHAWRKYYNKADTPESISEHAAYVAAQSHMPQSSTFAPLHAEMTISQVEKASLDQKLSSLKAELQNEWVAIEQLERTAFDQRVQILKREYETRFRSSKDVEESRLNDNLRELKEEHSKEVRDLRKKHDEIERNMKNDHLASLEDLRRQHESAVKKVKQELLDAEHRVQDDRDRRLKDLEEEEFERKSRFEGTKASDFEAFKSDVASKYTRRMREFEDEEMQKFNAKTHELKVKHEVDLSALREKMKQEQATTLASNLQNLTEVERLKYENEKEAIRLKYDADLSEIKSKEQKKFDALRAEIEASTEAKLRDLRDIGQKNESDEQARLEKLIKIQSEDARQKEEIAKSRLQLENDMKLERLRLELEAETRKLELNLQQTHSADMDAFKMKTAREMDEHKRKITNDHSRMLSILEAEYSRKIEAAKFKLLEGEKQTELKLIMEKEQEIAARKARAESEQRDVARLERDVENARIKVLAEKEALAQMERGITAALADEKLKLRLTEAKRDYAHSTKYDDGKPLDEIESECLIDTELDSSSMKEFDETPTKKHLRSLAESKIDQLIEQHFEGRSYATKPLSPLTESSKTETDDIAFKTKLNQIFNLKVDTKSNESRLHRRHKSSDLSEAEEITKELAKKAATLAVSVSHARKLSNQASPSFPAPQSAHAYLTDSFQIPIKTAQFISKPLPVALTVSELESKLSSMLGKARISKEAATKLKGHSSGSSVYSQSYFATPKSSRNSAWITPVKSPTRISRPLTPSFVHNASVSRQRRMTAGNTSIDWEGGHVETDLKLAERKAWLDKFMAEKGRL